MLIVDAHLDLAYNVARGRDVTRPAAEQPFVQNETATVGLPDLHAGGVGLVVATIFCDPRDPVLFNGYAGRGDAEGARAHALSQLDWYERQVDAGTLRLVRTPADVPAESAEVRGAGVPDGPDALPHSRTPALLLMEGSDPIRTPADVAAWHAAGLRMVGLAWMRTRHAGGTGEPGPLTPEGRALVAELDRHGILHDASHLAERSFWQLLDATAGPVCATHSNCRSLLGHDKPGRQMTDDMLRSIVERGGVVGVNFLDKFLVPAAALATRRATLADVADHVKHLCDLAGDAAHAGLGTDLDGGFGRERCPAEIATIADLPRVADALSSAGFGDEDVAGIMGGNWLRFFRASLPAD